MMKNAPDTSQLERCLRILNRLSSGSDVRVSDLERLFEGSVSRRTIERDLRKLSDANIPLTERKGVGNERIWSLDSRYRGYVPTLLCSDELNAALLLSQLTRLVQNTPFAEGVAQLQQRLRPIVPVDAIHWLQERSEASPFQLHLQGIIDYRPYTAYIQGFLQAIRDQKMCLVKYQKNRRAAIRTMKLIPQMVLLYSEALYAVAATEAGSKTLTLPFHRMTELEVLDESIVTDRVDQRTELFADRLGIVGHDDREPEQVVIRFHDKISEAMSERIWHRTQKIVENEDGTIDLTMCVHLTKELLAWVLRWQKYATVLQPEQLRKDVLLALHETLKNYSDMK